MKRHKGQVGIFAALFFILFALVVIASVLQIYTYHIIKEDTEDALAASNLASAIIDIEEYGISHNVVIANPENAFSIYKDALKVNMSLDENLNCVNNSSISGKITIVEYIIYNVRGSNVEVYCFGENSYSYTAIGGLGTVTAPNGQVIESTSIYSKISFKVKGIFNIYTEAKKEKLVDVVGN